ncbi:hypothetical protein RB619_05380 [Flavobacterium sp. LHD-80]|uniref:hypothetical protein n=1 Tax=Flavobacterium sp. LHD-80 TaxID=3071411 RepID=UPI0027DEF484|nr:hypothetical protein [Flavobacterium sp. LHD-80]MDQ6470069.1 hypothetical protein [Flavobacterium sp. LHD-80]
MKKIVLFALLSVLFTNCQSDDSEQGNADNSKSSISFILNDKTQYVTATDVSGSAIDVTWAKSEATANAENEYSIYGSFIIKNPASNDNRDSGDMYFQIVTSDARLTAGKTYDISFTYLNSGVNGIPLAYDPAVCYTSTDLFESSKTAGKIKITSFDGTTLKAEFSIDNLTNKNPYSDFGFCNGSRITEKSFSISKGNLTAVIE